MCMLQLLLLHVASELQLSVYEYKNHKLYASIENMFHITQLEHSWLCQIQKQGQTWNSKAIAYRAELTLRPYRVDLTLKPYRVETRDTLQPCFPSYKDPNPGILSLHSPCVRPHEMRICCMKA